MSFQLKLNSICLLWLLIQVQVQLQVQAQDIPVEFPEDFTTTTVEPVTELVETTTTTAATTTTEPATTTTTTIEATTEEVTTSTETVPDTTTTPVYPIYTPPTYIPHYPSRPTNIPQFPPLFHPWQWDSFESEAGLNCYLKEQAENKYVRWSCGFNSWKPTTSCYRCCYYSYSGYAGCSKLQEGRCSHISYFS